ncbi:MAG: deoxyribose-phosphate aldolase [Acholeplasmatales bacterium]|nr:deoxyribose-phosphate aldolase [Acholeplasmatales bacterium]
MDSKLFDHTLLKAFATKEEILNLCAEARKYNTKSVCVNPYWIETAREALKGSEVLVCTVIGFPLGANTIETKVFETKDAVARGAQECDIVINIGEAKMHNYAYIEKELKAFVEAAGKDVLTKVIIETCYLTDEEKVEVCKAAVRAGVDFVKTSTGFGTYGAKVEDVALMRKTVGPNVGVKASGGIHHAAEVHAMVEAGANRIGCSASVQCIEEDK